MSTISSTVDQGRCIRCHRNVLCVPNGVGTSSEVVRDENGRFVIVGGHLRRPEIVRLKTLYHELERYAPHVCG